MLEKKQSISAYSVAFPIKQGAYAETYRVKDSAGKNYFLKLFDCAKLSKNQFTQDGDIIEIEVSKQLKHPNLSSYHDSGDVIINGRQKSFVVYDFISGETVAEKVTRAQRCSVYEAKDIIVGVLDGIKYLHGLTNPIIHNELTIQNVMLDLAHETTFPKIIDFGYARFLNQGRRSFNKDGLNPFYMAPEAKVAFVIRIKGVNHIRPQVKKILRLLRLRQLNNGVFVKVNKATMNMIKRIEPYVTFGYPNRKTISDLIYKRGFAKINHARIPLSDNMIIENSLKQYNITCIEDLIEEIYRVGPHFKEANSFLWTFKMNNPKGGWSNKNHSFQNGGDWGNREEEINKLIRRMN